MFIRQVGLLRIFDVLENVYMICGLKFVIHTTLEMTSRRAEDLSEKEDTLISRLRRPGRQYLKSRRNFMPN